MASFKEMMKAFLYEDVDDDEEEVAVEETIETPGVRVETEEEAARRIQEQQAAVAAAAAAQAAATAPIQTAEQAAPVINTPAEEVESAKTSATTIGLEADGKKKSEKTTEQKKSPYRYNRKQPRRLPENTEYQAVISPIFGNIHDEEKQYEAVHDAINLPKPPVQEDITSVISPMFGSARPDLDELDEIPVYRPRKKSITEETVGEELVVSQEQLPAVENKTSDLGAWLTKESISAPASENQSEKKD